MPKKMTLTSFLRAYVDHFLSEYGFTRNGLVFTTRSDEGVTAWAEFRPARRQSETSTFRVDVGFGLDDFFVRARRGILPANQVAGLSIGGSYRVEVPSEYQSLLIDPVMKRARDLFSFLENGDFAAECADAFTRSWVDTTWPWLEPRLTLDGIERLVHFPPREDLEKARRRLTEAQQ